VAFILECSTVAPRVIGIEPYPYPELIQNRKSRSLFESFDRDDGKVNQHSTWESLHSILVGGMSSVYAMHVKLLYYTVGATS
jgi:hypothetical protein